MKDYSVFKGIESVSAYYPTPRPSPILKGLGRSSTLKAHVFCIHQVLIGKKIDDEESDVEDCLYENGSSVLPSYLPNAGNPQICVTMNTAIAFVNRF